MKVIPLAIPEVSILEPEVFGDDRDFFFESFNQAKFEAAIGRHVTFVQDSHDGNDQAIAIQWPLAGEPVLSAKDQQGKSLAVAEPFA